MKSTALAVGTTPVLLAKGPCRVQVQHIGGPVLLVGEQAVSLTTGLRADSDGQFKEFVLLPGEKLWGVSDAATDVRVMEYGLP